MKALFVGMVFLAAGTAEAWNCEHEKEVDQVLHLGGAQQLVIEAGAGELEISGDGEPGQVRVRGRVCVSQEDWLEQSELLVTEGARYAIRTELPELGDDWSVAGRRYAYFELELEVPGHLPLVIVDGDGDIEIDSVAGITLSDQAGDLLIEDSVGPIVIRDSSGDIELQDIVGDVVIESDTSGDIRGDDIMGSVRVAEDSSGEIRFSDVGADFIVERDTSGDILADGVLGDFRVLKDGQGEVTARDVGGEIQIPGNKS